MSIERKSMVTIQPRRLCLASLAGLSYLDHRFLLPVILSIATSRRTQNHSALVSLVALWDHPQLYNSARFVSPYRYCAGIPTKACHYPPHWTAHSGLHCLNVKRNRYFIANQNSACLECGVPGQAEVLSVNSCSRRKAYPCVPPRIF